MQNQSRFALHIHSYDEYDDSFAVFVIDRADENDSGTTTSVPGFWLPYLVGEWDEPDAFLGKTFDMKGAPPFPNPN